MNSLRYSSVRTGQVGVGQDKLFSFNTSTVTEPQLPTSIVSWPDGLTVGLGSEFVIPIYIRCPFAGDRSLRVDARYTLATQLPLPGTILFSLLRLQESDSSQLVTENNQISETSIQGASQMPIMCIQSKRVQLSTVTPFQICSHILSLQVSTIYSLLNACLSRHLFMVYLFFCRMLQSQRLLLENPSF